MRIAELSSELLAQIRQGLVIPAMPLALTATRTFDIRYQRALIRYYLAAGAGGLAVGVHTTQFNIRQPDIDLFEPVLSLAAEEIDRSAKRAIFKVAGVCGPTPQALREASFACQAGYHACLLSLKDLASASTVELLAHCQALAKVMPVIGFYLQPAVGGRVLPYEFWRRFVEIDNVLAIKIAAFNRYQTLDVIRAVCDAGREKDITLYTGNDDHILLDLLTPFQVISGRTGATIHFAGGLLGHWAVWTHTAVELLQQVHNLRATNAPIPPHLLTLAAQITDCNAAFFDAANNFRGCIPGLHEVLRRQGLLQGCWCLDAQEILSPGQRAEIDRVYHAYPHLNDDAFVQAHREEWLAE